MKGVNLLTICEKMLISCIHSREISCDHFFPPLRYKTSEKQALRFLRFVMLRSRPNLFNLNISRPCSKQIQLWVFLH